VLLFCDLLDVLLCCVNNKKDFENLILAPVSDSLVFVHRKFFFYFSLCFPTQLMPQVFGEDNILEDASDTVTSKVVPETKSIYERQK